jgi:hypothetical protein
MAAAWPRIAGSAAATVKPTRGSDLLKSVLVDLAAEPGLSPAAL